MRQHRHLGRELALAFLYALDFNGNLKAGATMDEFPALSDEEREKLNGEAKLFARYLIEGTLEHLDEIDAIIARYSINRSVDRINLVDRNILRISVFSLLYEKDVHSHVVIAEAVTLSQEYSNEVNYKFINGLLDALIKDCHDNAEEC